MLRELEGIDYSEMLPEIQGNIESIKEDLHERVNKYKEFIKLYSKKNEIKLNGHTHKEERD